MKRIAACLVACVAGVAPAALVMSAAAAAPPDDSATTTSTTIAVLPVEGGPVAPVPIGAPSAPLVAIPSGCPSPPVASVIFVGVVVAKVAGVARFQIEQIRAGEASSYIYGDLVDIHYDNETQYLTANHRYLVGAAPAGPDLSLWSKVRETNPLFGGNAVIGLTEKSTECPPLEDPVRTLNIDGTEVDNGILMGLSSEKKEIALAVLTPLAVAFGIVLLLVTVRWILTGFFLTARHAVGGPRQRIGPTSRRRIG